MTPNRPARTARAAGRLLALALAVALFGCDGNGNGDDAAADGTGVTISGNTFDPDPVTVAVGDEVSWTNEDQAGHTVTAGEPGAPTEAFDETVDGSGGTASVTFDESGTFSYFCRFHPQMTATVVVE